MLPFSILALGGGGTKGFLHIGAIRELEKYGKLTDFLKGIYGCSIGSIMATGVAFGMNSEQIERLSRKYLNSSSIVKLEVASLKNSITKKGIFEMDLFEKSILEAFQSEGIDLKNKYLKDSLIPLYIVTSNITKGVPAIFQDNIPVMLALRASCCIPVIFRPQIMNGNVYVDGGAITNTLSKIILKEHQPNTLSINIVYNNTKISPHNLENLSPIEFMYRLHKNACYFEHKQSVKPNELDLYHSLSSGVTDPTTEDQDEMIRTGQLLTHNFLSKRGY